MKAKTARDRKRRELLKVYDEKRRKLKALRKAVVTDDKTVGGMVILHVNETGWMTKS